MYNIFYTILYTAVYYCILAILSLLIYYHKLKSKHNLKMLKPVSVTWTLYLQIENPEGLIPRLARHWVFFIIFLVMECQKAFGSC